MTDAPAETSRMLDGNAAAGPLAELFAVELTAAVLSCAACRNSAPLAVHQLYADAPALVVRCPSCTAVVLRYGDTGGRLRLDLSGVTMLVLEPDAVERSTPPPAPSPS